MQKTHDTIINLLCAGIEIARYHSYCCDVEKVDDCVQWANGGSLVSGNTG